MAGGEHGRQILLAVTDETTAERCYRKFKWDVLVPDRGGPLGAGLSTLVRPPDDVFYTELQTRYRRVRLFLPTLLHQVHFEAAPAGAAVVAALEYLKRREAPARAQDVAPSAVVTTA